MIEQTKQLRKTDEEIDEEIIEENEQKFFDKNKDKSFQVTDQTGNTKKISIAQFMTTDDDLFGDLENGD